MNLDILLGRAKEIETAMTNVNNQLQALAGHKTEVQYWIEQLNKPDIETKVDESVAPTEEVPVE